VNNEQLDFIIKDLHKRGILLDDLRDEIIDHVCSAVEERMAKGVRFADAYEQIIEIFGNTAGLQETQKQTAMLQNFFVVAFRNLKKQRFYTSINIAGLAVGVASCLIIMLYVLNELSYDKHFKDYDRVYRIQSEIKFGDNHLVMALTPAPISETVQKDFPEVEAAARFWNRGTRIFRRTEESFKEPNTVMADSSLFNVLDIPLLAGDKKTALRELHTMIISRKAAEKYFPGESALNQSLIGNNNDSWKITGVFEDLPENTHFELDFILSLITADYNRDGNWLSNNFHTYIKLKKGTDAKALEAKFPKMVVTYAGPQAKAALGPDFSMEKFTAAGNKIEFTLIQLIDIHLYSDREHEIGTNSSIAYVYLFGAIAIFILVIACINFMNLSTARSSNRAKEVGIRKVMGSFRSHLIRQFLTESVILSVISFVIAILIAWICIPILNDMALKHLALPFASPVLWLLLVGAALVTGVLAGLYPSFFLSAFRPAAVLKGNVALGTKSGIIRGALVVFQFWISIVLIVGTIAVNRQLSYIQTKKIGFNKDQVIVVKDPYALKDQLQSFKEEVEKDSHIKCGTISGFLPVEGTYRSDNTYWPAGKSPTQDNLIATQTWGVDHDYVKTLGMKIVEGRDFSREFLTDSSE
jgi:putative ABC transport system permease protein